MSHNKSSATTARNKTRLQHVLTNPNNKFCADCKTSRNPRWASWNLGVFICIRCSGIHRSLGTHVSRVKSVDLDSWTDEQTQKMEEWGNERANLYWEAKLFQLQPQQSHQEGRGDGYVPIEGKVESFVRTKYALGKWKADMDRESYIASSSSSSTLSSATTSSLGSPNATPNSTKGNLLDDLLGNSSIQQPSRFQSNVQQVPKSKVNPTVDLLKQTTSASASSIPQSTSLQSSQSTGNSGVNRADLKKNILSLYSTPTNSSPNLGINQQRQPVQQQQQQFRQSPLPTYNMGSNSSLSNSSSSNVWSTPTTTGNKFVNDDPFKNVWQ